MSFSAIPPMIVALIPAGGVGSRAQEAGYHQPKQYRQIHGKTMLEHTVGALLAHPLIHTVHIGVVPEDDWVNTLTLPERCIVHPTGGASRAETVLNTLKVLPEEDIWVLVHDAARPGLPFACLDQLIHICLRDDIGGILALPVGDTVKRASTDHTNEVTPLIDKTISRNGLWLAQTPQLFKRDLLTTALQQALAVGFDVTDEASAIEFIQAPCRLVKGHWHNLKVTWPEDFELVESFL